MDWIFVVSDVNQRRLLQHSHELDSDTFSSINKQIFNPLHPSLASQRIARCLLASTADQNAGDERQPRTTANVNILIHCKGCPDF